MKYLLPFLILCCLQCRDKKTTVRVEAGPIDTSVVIQPDTGEEISQELPEELPSENFPDFDTTQWEELARVEPGILLDMRYATENNFVKEEMYDCGRCFLRPEVARAVVAVHRSLQEQGYGLKMYDCYRPRPIQWKLWNKVPDTRYVADPKKGSMHNRGMAVDLTIVDSEGRELDMGTDFDFFGEEAYQGYPHHPADVLKNRQLLLETMETNGLLRTPTEWWHYSYRAKTFPLDDWLWPCQ